jgi:hypothetical protein
MMLATFDKDVAKSISHTWWLQLKWTYSNQAAPKKGDKGSAIPATNLTTSSSVLQVILTSYPILPIWISVETKQELDRTMVLEKLAPVLPEL